MKVNKLSKGAGGAIFYNPKVSQERIRVMIGNVKNPHAASKNPYVVVSNKAGLKLDINGVACNDPAKWHIPLEDFIFKG